MYIPAYLPGRKHKFFRQKKNNIDEEAWIYIKKRRALKNE